MLTCIGKTPQISEQERLRMEAEARDSGEQLREMAEKVFQLLERLKLSELGKTKAMEAMRKKEQEMIALKKKNARLIKESTREGKARVKVSDMQLTTGLHFRLSTETCLYRRSLTRRSWRTRSGRLRSTIARSPRDAERKSAASSR
jgi:hypothetical protein